MKLHRSLNSNGLPLRFFLFALLVIFPFFSHSQIPLIKTFNSDQGLTSEFVKDIVEDKDGYLWVATHIGVFKFDGVRFQPVNFSEKNEPVRKLFLDSNNGLWVSSVYNGMYLFHQNQWINIKEVNDVRSFYKHSDDEIWVSAKDGLKVIDKDFNVHEIQSLYPGFRSDKKISQILPVHPELVVLGSDGKLLLFDSKEKTFTAVELEELKGHYIFDLMTDQNHQLWIATNKSLFKYDLVKQVLTRILDPEKNTHVSSLERHQNTIYAGAYEQGLLEIDPVTHKVKQFLHNPMFSDSIAENTITSLYKSKDNILWIGNFHKGISHWNLNAAHFNYYTNIDSSDSCSSSNVYYAGYLDSDEKLWLGTSSGLVRMDLKNNSCVNINSSATGQSVLSNISSIVETQDSIYISSFKGLAKLNKSTLDLTVLITDQFVNQIFVDGNNQLFFYYQTKPEMFRIHPETDEIKPVEVKKLEMENLRFKDVTLRGETVILATTKGLAHLSKEGFVEAYRTPLDKTLSQGVNSVSSFKGTLLLTTTDGSILSLDENDNIISQFTVQSEPQLENANISKSVYSQDGKQVWMSSEKGLIRLKDNKLHFFHSSDGVNNYIFYKNFAFLGHDGQLYFGGQNGFVHFHPENIQINQTPPPIVINKMTLLNKEVEPNKETATGFAIAKPINEMDSIELGYKDYILGFEFAALDYADPMRNQYAYRLQGLNEDWVHTDARDRKATYTNLKAGDYTFQVKASNKDGIWTDEPKELKIKVYPAPWLSPWAYFAYVMTLIVSIWGFIRYKTIASRRRAEELEVTVKERTHEVLMQKKMVESLLDHKNEVFANVTHEFKTPLSLILGPSEQLGDEPELVKHQDKLSMIQRNAKRLMLMVGQILKLSEAEQNKEVIRESQALQPLLTMLFESFNPLAQDKHIQLDLINDIEANVYATPECLEIVISNLISNALKYTQRGGQVRIESFREGNSVRVSVTDTGSGIEKSDLDKIFQRFTRLEGHKGIQGTGIGLSVVKEITEANGGHVAVESEPGKGSVFSVVFPISEISATEEMSQVMVDQLVANTANEIVSVSKPDVSQSSGGKNQITVLSIEDNQDMQQHIGNVLKERFHCFFADHGKDGIAIALKEVPDIIICDVMMPGMDGYQVTRILRHDPRTSHIPIILLTALNTRESRIKGWRENIDVYVTKPFDATELNVQIDNILTLRKMLQQKTNEAIKSNGSLESLELPEQDQKFIEKLKSIISELYSNEYIQKADLAAKMAVSERQLQRKVKALIDEKPMDMLRDYRLQQAALKLKTGRQVGLVSDECGFSSVSYFGSCFKNKYGMTPKKYQNLKQKSS